MVHDHAGKPASTFPDHAWRSARSPLPGWNGRTGSNAPDCLPKHGLTLSLGDQLSPWQEPRWNADRRARPQSARCAGRCSSWLRVCRRSASFLALLFAGSGEGKQTTLRIGGKRSPGFSTRSAKQKSRSKNGSIRHCERSEAIQGRSRLRRGRAGLLRRFASRNDEVEIGSCNLHNDDGLSLVRCSG